MFERLPTVRWGYNEDTSDITWRYEDYCLRIERMNGKWFWWAVYFKGDAIEFDDPYAKTIEQAMAFAEAGFYSHLISKMEE